MSLGKKMCFSLIKKKPLFCDILYYAYCILNDFDNNWSEIKPSGETGVAYYNIRCVNIFWTLCSNSFKIKYTL